MQRIKLDINPKGEIPVLHVAQYDKGRSFEVELVEGEQAYNVPSGYSVQLNVRKTDSKLVTAAPDNIVDNILTFSTTEQMTACAGENIASVTFKDADNYVITTLYFLISVQRDVLAGGLDSASEIHNLEQQIAVIVPEVIGDDYYNKSETDSLLDNKANRSELSDLASKAELEYAIDEEDADLKDWVTTHFATPGYIASNYYKKYQVDELLDNIFPTLSASGAIASFVTALSKPLVSVTHDASVTTMTRCGKNLFDISDGNGNIMRGVTPAYDNDGGLTFSGTVSEVGWCGSWNIDITLPAGTYTFSISNPEIDHNITFALDWTAKVVIDRNTASKTVTFNAPQRLNRITLNSNSEDVGQNININVKKFVIEVGNTATAYEPYNGQTVPVADATTLTTLSGVNNVFADIGNVTVQYKYMSI